MRKCISLILCLLITAGLSAWAETPAVFASDMIGTEAEAPGSGLPAPAAEAPGTSLPAPAAEAPGSGLPAPAPETLWSVLSASAPESAGIAGTSAEIPQAGSRIPSGSMPAGFMTPVPGRMVSSAGSGSPITTGKPCPGKRRPSGRQQRPLWTGCRHWK